MIGYDDYIKKIKEREAPADFDGMHRAIGRKIMERRRVRSRAARAGALAIFAICLISYFGYPFIQDRGSGQLFSYVFEQQDNSDSPVIDYVFSDAGTI
jgi:hypothetical protein